MTTSALRRQATAQHQKPQTTDLHTGFGAEMFSSGSLCREAQGDMVEGAGTSLFSSGSAPQDDRTMSTGAATGLFSSGS
ncbi:hypothetical protein [Phaeobacter sp. C3_T13_0]|uniref:hypothetical protein n=1 Tax=Phaeobacter cretensis TaxID=3342641 RepID=UPI0039BD0255